MKDGNNGECFHNPPCDPYDREIKLIQCKTGKSKKKAVAKVEQSDIKKWEGLYSVSVEVV